MASRRTVDDALDLFEHVRHGDDDAGDGTAAEHADDRNCRSASEKPCRHCVLGNGETNCIGLVSRKALRSSRSVCR